FDFFFFIVYKCKQCPAVFKIIWNLARHVNTHNGILYSCTACEKKYNDKSNLSKHMKNVHAILHTPAAQIVQLFAPRIIRPALPDFLTGSSNMSDDDICMAAMDNFEKEEEVQQRYIEIAP
ncbi:zinc finger protein 467-like, partial [Aphis craccivora]